MPLLEPRLHSSDRMHLCHSCSHGLRDLPAEIDPANLCGVFQSPWRSLRPVVLAREGSIVDRRLLAEAGSCSFDGDARSPVSAGKTRLCVARRLSAGAGDPTGKVTGVSCGRGLSLCQSCTRGLGCRRRPQGPPRPWAVPAKCSSARPFVLAR
jgi:hypothetical protein